MKVMFSLAVGALVLPSLAMAHVTARPRLHAHIPNVPPRALATDQAPAQTASDTAAVERWLGGYAAAFNRKDLAALGAFYHPDVTIYEGGGINNGWADYRDHHLGPELKAFENLQFTHSDRTVTLLPGGQSAYSVARYSLKAKMGDREVDSQGLETLLVIKQADGTWKIRHSHTSSRPRRPAAQ